MKQVWLVIVCAWLVSTTAHAEEARALHYDLSVDLGLTLSAGTLLAAGYALHDELTPAHCNWCDDNAFDRRAREHLRASDTVLAGTLSDVGALAVVPAVSLVGLVMGARQAQQTQYFWQDALFVLEALSVAALLNQVVKVEVARERPYVHYDAFAGQPRGSFERTSFYSAHTNSAFAIASAAGMVASLRGYRLAPLIWALGMTCATLVGYGRVASDYHYLSDVLVGAALGSLAGAGLPWLLHRPESRLGTISVSAHGIVWSLRR